ncbi:hypothetical protein [Rhizobium etli]|uniref:hypothetical protein n=1 Tax=Rhizobium etli TaxID=29449 RepID=UPI000383980E|nr:hypothetical protein [Rhizobium etli]AGS22464.1 hypothetical protein REMIM1_CH02697 [Rhizobium etli bv. mimosae str. Mim1]
MKVEILYRGKVIGCSDLQPVDPPMGVAAGPLDATLDYDPLLHAYVIDGDDNDVDSNALSARSAEFGMIICAVVCVEDFNKTLNELNVTLLGIAEPDYATVFAAHPMHEA